MRISRTAISAAFWVGKETINYKWYYTSYAKPVAELVIHVTPQTDDSGK